MSEDMQARRHNRRSAWSSKMDHDEEWERKKIAMLKKSSTSSRAVKKFVGRCSSDCTGYSTNTTSSDHDHARARSLTDADLDELRGCIDLGFSFNESDTELWDTIPALELCYAISQHFKPEAASSSSPCSETEDGTASSASSSASPRCWQISSPGDAPQQVKARLRQWARAVACTLEQQDQQQQQHAFG